VLEQQFRRQFSVARVGIAGGARSHFYAISVERRIKHPAVVAICDTARREIFA